MEKINREIYIWPKENIYSMICKYYNGSPALKSWGYLNNQIYNRIEEQIRFQLIFLIYDELEEDLNDTYYIS